MSIAVSGSIAYDHIMHFYDQFTNHILADQLDHLSVSFLIAQKTSSAGGTAQNIAYNLGLLGHKDTTAMLGAVGKDFKPDPKLETYISYDHIIQDADLDTAAAYIIGDKQSNQITSFYPGALGKAGEQSLLDLANKPAYSIVAPNDKAAMLRHLKESHENGIISFFAPGQMTSFRDKADILEGAKYADNLVVNEYEFDLICQKTNLSDTDLVQLFDKVIITLGAKGVLLRDHSSETHIHGATVKNVVEPTGAGDAFVAGLVGSLANGTDRTDAAKVGNILASFVVEQNGTMVHCPSMSDIDARYQETY